MPFTTPGPINMLLLTELEARNFGRLPSLRISPTARLRLSPGSSFVVTLLFFSMLGRSSSAREWIHVAAVKWTRATGADASNSMRCCSTTSGSTTPAGR